MSKLLTLTMALSLVALCGGIAQAAGTPLLNAGFELTDDVGDASNWTEFASGNGASLHSTLMPRSGTGHMDLQVGGANEFAGVFQSGVVTFPEGAEVTFSGWNKSLVDPFNGTAEVKIEWVGAAQLRVDHFAIGTEYEQFSISGVAPAGVTAATITYAISTFNPDAGENNVYIDDFLVTATPEPTSVMLGMLGLLGLAGLVGRRR